MSPAAGEPPAETVMAVTVNGVDNVGKTTHLHWLSKAMRGSALVGSLDAWDSRWRSVAGNGFARWWFADSSTAEHMELIFASHMARRRAGEGALALEDRGWPMLVAVCAATAAVKLARPVEETLDQVERAASVYRDPGRRAIHVLLRHGGEPEEEARLAVERDQQEPSVWYAPYQRALASVIALQVAHGRYDVIIERGDRSLLAVQRDVRDALLARGAPVEPLPADRLDHLWVLSGMSESGKSTVGELLRVEHGVTRLKIGYLLETAAARAGVRNPYEAWDERTQAQSLSEEILRFAAANPGSSRISVESAHRLDSTAHLQQIWGTRCRVVFLRVPRPVRAARTPESDTQLALRDATKQARGADLIADIADHVIDNTGSLAKLKATVMVMAAAIDDPITPPQATMLIPESLRGFLGTLPALIVDDDTALLAVTGSLAHGDWRAGWSDVDLLLVRDQLPVSWLRERLGVLRSPDGIKVAVSAYTTAEITSGLVPPRLLHALRTLGADGAGILYRRDGLRLPSITECADDRASRGELPLVVMVLRRLSAQADIDTRAVYKHIILVMKIHLRADGIAAEASDDVINAFRQAHPEAGIRMPVLAELPEGWATDSGLAATVLTAADATLNYYHHRFSTAPMLGAPDDRTER